MPESVRQGNRSPRVSADELQCAERAEQDNVPPKCEKLRENASGADDVFMLRPSPVRWRARGLTVI